MIIKYNEEQLLRIIEDIFILTGISISILDTDYNRIASSVKRQKYCSLLQTIETEQDCCYECDKIILNRCRTTQKLEYHTCRAGLYDSAMPIIKYDTVVGYVLMGQVRSVDSPASLQYFSNTDSQTLKRLNQFYSETPFISKDRLDALYDLLPHILFDNAIEIVYDSFVTEVVNYIDANLNGDLSIERLCLEFYVSKNRLYDAFHNNLGSTVTGFVNERRIKKAKELLWQTNDSVYKIAETVGICNYTYFCKLFKKLSGVTPTEYRKCPSATK